jgi:4-amino-4-deoxy-L-arabinose transferase-like glycosyltransferase
VSPRRFRLALAVIAAIWLAARLVFWNGYYVEDAPGYVTDAIWMAVGNYHVRNHVNGLNVGTYLPVALPIAIFGKTEAALSVWPLACSLLGLLSLAGTARVFFGGPYGLLAAFLYATYPGDVFFSTVVMPDAIQAGWLSLSIFLIVSARGAAAKRRLLICAGAALGVCHLVRANDILLLPVGLIAAFICSAGRDTDRIRAGSIGVLWCFAGWCLVVAAEGLVYAIFAGDFLWRLHVVQAHYGTPGSIARAGLNVDPWTIPFSLFAPLEWWFRGGWGRLNQEQAYHGLLFSLAIVLLAGGATALWWQRGKRSQATAAGLGVAAAWLLWPLLFHQFGSQSVTEYVPMHRLSRHFVVYAPGAIFAIVAGAYAIAEVVRAARSAQVTAAAYIMALAAMLGHLVFNWQGERLAFDAFHRIKETYGRILVRLPDGVRTIVADPGDLCFFDFWMNPLGSERVRMMAFAAYDRCDQIGAGVVLTQSNRGWTDAAPVIVDTVRRLPCLTQPPPTWQLLYDGYPEKVFVITEEDRHGRK